MVAAVDGYPTEPVPPGFCPGARLVNSLKTLPRLRSMKGASQGKTSPMPAARRIPSAASLRPAVSSATPAPLPSPTQRVALAALRSYSSTDGCTRCADQCSEGSRPPPTAFSGHPGRHNVATETRGRRPRSLHNRQILSPEPSTSRYGASLLVTAATPARPTIACSRRLPDHFSAVEALTRLPHG